MDTEQFLDDLLLARTQSIPTKVLAIHAIGAADIGFYKVFVRFGMKKWWQASGPVLHKIDYDPQKLPILNKLNESAFFKGSLEDFVQHESFMAKHVGPAVKFVIESVLETED